ncbi:MAG: cysteine desulfurase family protein [Promethearchaeati archaeon SRVP18_Atabeyarchaeia-1]
MSGQNAKRIYMDHVAGSPVDPRVLKEMLPYFTDKYGNPSSVHSAGMEAKSAVETARGQLVQLIGAENPREIVFTSGGTESNNLAIKGVASKNKDKGNHIVSTPIEHMSILNTLKSLEKEGFKITYAPVDEYGLVDVGKLKSSITAKTVLITLAYANGEIGTIQPIAEIGEIAADKGVPLHVDAVAAAGKIPINVKAEQIDLMTISSNDMYGPKGMGVLYVGEDVRIQPIIQGGGQEMGMRSGTENVPGIVGIGKAAELAKNEMKDEGKRLTKLRDKLIKGLLESVDHAFLNGHPTKRVPNNANIRFSYVEGESMILNLDMLGVSLSSGSACTSKKLEPSHVLIGIGCAHEEAHGSLQFSLGKSNTDSDVDVILKNLPDIVKKLRAMSPIAPSES